MSFRRIYAIVLQEIFITSRSMEIIFDIFIYSLISLFLFGFLSLYLVGTQNTLAAKFLLLGMLLWDIIRIIQYSLCMGSLLNVWARNLCNMFIAPLRVSEYLLAHTFSGIVKAILVFVLDAVIATAIFHFNIYQIGPLDLLIFFINLSIFAFLTGVVILGLIFRYGMRIQAFAWGLVPILQPLTAALFPVKVLPTPLQAIAYLFPCTYIFEAARYRLVRGNSDWYAINIAFFLNVLYLLLSLLFFSIMFRNAKNSGQFARNES
jgi:ABC-2 type transport system permease protein